MLKSTVLNPHSFLSIFLVLICIGTSSFAGDAFDTLKNAIRVTQQTSFQGTMEFQKNVFDEIWTAEFTIHHKPDTATKLVFLKPKIVEGNIVIRTPKGIWVTPLTDEKRDKVIQEMKPFPWHRLLDENHPLFFQASFEIGEENLVVNNYAIHSGVDHINEEKMLSVHLKPYHDDRPSMKAYFDFETNVQKQCKRYDYNQELDESFVFTNLTINAALSPSVFSLENLKNIHTFGEKNSAPDIQPDFMTYQLQWLPIGFELLHSDTWKGRHGITKHDIFSDGFARISIYQRKLDEDEIENNKTRDNEKKPSKKCIVHRFKKHSSWLYFRDIDGLRISAVGDLSPKLMGKTLSKIDDK